MGIISPTASNRNIFHVLEPDREAVSLFCFFYQGIQGYLQNKPKTTQEQKTWFQSKLSLSVFMFQRGNFPKHFQYCAVLSIHVRGRELPLASAYASCIYQSHVYLLAVLVKREGYMSVSENFHCTSWRSVQSDVRIY